MQCASSGKNNRYDNYRPTLFGEITISLSVDSYLKGMASYPKLTN
jgi:hypothetical protein